MTIKVLNSLVPEQSGGSLPPVDLSSATVDYALAVGETAYLNYTNVTSVPLHIATYDGAEYEVTIQGNKTVSASNGTAATLSANNTTISNITRLQRYNSTSNATPQGATATADTQLLLGVGRIDLSILRIITSTVSKSLIARTLCKSDTDTWSYDFFNSWTDTSTAWTSLGTVTFPFAQSGKVIIRRII